MLDADRAKFEHDRKTEEWSVVGWKRKAEAEAALLYMERKNWKEICEKYNTKKMGLRNAINNLKAEKAEPEAARDKAHSHRERSEQREEQLKAEAESAKKDLELERTKQAETSHLLTGIEYKLENSKAARATAESELEPLKSDMLWLKEHGIASVAESVLNSEELDKTVAHLLVAAWNDGFAQCKSATHGVDTEAALVAAKTQFNTLQLHVMDLINVALHSEEFMTCLREIFLDREEGEDEDLA
ncbi:hypothetical protein Hanom_Chr00s000002g01599931 [Helianthus anomalus]